MHNHETHQCCTNSHNQNHNHTHNHSEELFETSCGCSCGCGHSHSDGEQKETLMKIIISGVLLLLAMLSSKLFILNKYTEFALYLIPYLIIGYEVLTEAAKNILKGKALDENFLMAVASIGAFILSEYPEAVAVMLFFQIGELFEGYATKKSKKSIGTLMDLKPDFANLERDNVITKVSPDTVNIGDIIVVKPGEKIPLDGTIIDGSSSLDTSSLTGESLPKDVTIGDDVISGCINKNGIIKILVTVNFSDSAVSKIIRLTNKAAENSAKSEKFITKFAKIYTPCVVAAAFIIGLVPSIIFKNPSVWVTRAITFLVVSCPCALVVSVPLCFFMGMGKASKQGILIKGGEYIEKLANCKNFIFDKTGTITKGVFKITAVHPEEASKEQLLECAAYGEYFSNHPISKTIKDEYEKEFDLTRINDYQELSGKGVSVTIDDKKLLIGNQKLMDENNIQCHPCHKPGTIIHIGINNKYMGHIVISDTIKDDSKTALKHLTDIGVTNTIMLTGDSKDIAEDTAKKVGINTVYASLLPTDKLEITQKISKEQGITAFVGDGINDAPALTASDIGIAMGGIGSDAAIEAADAVIMDDNLLKLAKAVKISKQTVFKAYTNIIFILAIKAVILILGALGITGMWAAVFADVGSLVLSVLNSAFLISKN